jgi:Na+-driven multidrug efflux pump
MPETSTCLSFSCRETVEGSVEKCPKCGTKMRTPKMVRRLGWFLLLIGLFLVGLMGTITWNMAPALLHPYSPESNFTGTAEQAKMILRLFAVVIAFGIGTMINGTYQIVTRRRNGWITAASLGLAVVLFVVAWTTNRGLGG